MSTWAPYAAHLFPVGPPRTINHEFAIENFLQLLKIFGLI